MEPNQHQIHLFANFTGTKVPPINGYERPIYTYQNEHELKMKI